MKPGWVYLAFRRGRLIGGAWSFEEAKALGRPRVPWRDHGQRAAEQSSWNLPGVVVATAGSYTVRRVPMPRGKL